MWLRIKAHGLTLKIKDNNFNGPCRVWLISCSFESFFWFKKFNPGHYLYLKINYLRSDDRRSEVSEQILKFIQDKQAITKLKKLKKLQQNEEHRYLMLRKMMTKEQSKEISALEQECTRTIIEAKNPEPDTLKALKSKYKEDKLKLRKKHLHERATCDIEMLMKRDFMIFNQQAQLVTLGFPGIKSTNESSEIEAQMKLIEIALLISG